MSQLTGIRVLELASVLAGPAVGQFFAELGADVIKVENLRAMGDVTRSWKVTGELTDDRSAYFCSVNWGKKSMAIDLQQKKGQEIVKMLARNADIVIASYKPGDAKKLGMDYHSLKREKEDLIYGQVTGYGPQNAKVGYDAIIQAESGFMSMNGERGGPSLKMPVALIDVLAGHHLKEGVLLAMLHKQKTGEGQLVEVSLMDAAISSLTNQATNWLIANKLPGKHGSAHPNIAPYGDVFITSDDREFILAVGTDRQFADLCKLLGASDMSANPLFATNSLRVKNRAALNSQLTALIRTWSGTELLEKVNLARIPAGLIQNLEVVFQADEARRLLLHHDGLTSVKTFLTGLNAFEGPHFLPPPRLGEHTREILADSLGFSSNEIDSLRSASIIN